MTRRVPAFTVLLWLASVVAASAQAPVPQGPRRDRELSFGGVVALPSSMGTADAVLDGPNGAPALTLFSTENRLATGVGADVTLGFRLGRAVVLEFSGAVTRAGLRTVITDDFEGAPDQVLSGSVMRVSAEAALAFYFRETGATSWFLRGSAGLIRETSGSDLLAASQGFTASGGVGWRRWLRTTTVGTFKRIGLRAEARAAVRSNGISLSSRSVQFGPLGVVHLVLGF